MEMLWLFLIFAGVATMAYGFMVRQAERRAEEQARWEAERRFRAEMEREEVEAGWQKRAY